MTKITIISVTTIAMIGALATLMTQHRSQTNLRTGTARLQEQSNQLTALAAEFDRLSHPTAQADGESTGDHTAELARLRNEAEALKKRTNDLGWQLKINHESWPARHTTNQQINMPEYYQQQHVMAVSRMDDAKVLCLAFYLYACDHQNQSPVSLVQLAPYLAKEGQEGRSFSGTNQFQIVYQESLDQLQGIPPGSVAVVRDQQAWLGPNDKMMRVYGFADGHSQIVSSDDNFQSYEAQHVIMPPPATPSDQ